MADFEARMAALRARFAARAIAGSEAIRRHLAEHARQPLREICHDLAGAAGTFGFPTIGEAALAVEEALDAVVSDRELDTLTDILLMRLDALRQER